MRCVKCGKELEGGARFCPYCGAKVPDQEKVPEQAAGDGPLYQAEVKGLLRSGRLVVYRDRVEFEVSKVQKMVLPFASLAAVKKGVNQISFLMEDGRTESCAVSRKDLHQAFFTIEQASRPFLDQRARRLRAGGVRCSFPSSPAGLGGVLSSGLLDILDDRAEYRAPSDKNSETIPYRDVKAARISAMGALEFVFYDGTRKAFTVGREFRAEVSGFFQTALAPFIEARRAALLEQGIHFSFPNSQSFNRGVLNIFGDRLAYTTDEGQSSAVAFRDIRAVSAADSTLEVALTDGTTQSFPFDRDYREEVLAFLDGAIAPYAEERTKGFDLSFGTEEKLEINEARGVFHILRQGGREISPPWGLADLIRAEIFETPASRDLVGSLLTARGGDGKTRSPEERISAMGVQLTVHTEQGTETLPVRFASFTLGALRSSPEYQRCAEEQAGLAACLEAHCPDCELVLPPPAESGNAEEPEDQLPADAAPESPGGGQQEAASVGAVERSQFGTLIDGIADFVQYCGTPMTIAIQGDWESGSGSFIHMVHDCLEESFRGNVLWLHTRQFAQLDGTAQLPALLADKLLEQLGAAVNSEAKKRTRMIVQGVIGIASGWLSQGSSNGQEVNEAIFGNNSAASLEQKVQQFTELVRRRCAKGGKVIFFVDDLNRLTPARAVEVLDAMGSFFDCPGCLFIVSVDQETVVRGKRGLGGPDYSEEKGEAYFDRLFKTVFRVPKDSFDVRKYIADNLGRVNIPTGGEEELRHYSQLALLSVGSEPKALERLFNSFLLLKSVAGEDAFASGERRLALFSLLCMQSRFFGAYRCLVRMKDRLTPALLTSLPAGSPLEEQAGLSETERRAFRAFAGELCGAINTNGAAGITDEECRAFASALTISAITSSK